jgi:hypothetical protein
VSSSSVALMTPRRAKVLLLRGYATGDVKTSSKRGKRRKKSCMLESCVTFERAVSEVNAVVYSPVCGERQDLRS